MIASQIITDIQVNSKSEIMLHVGYYHMGDAGIFPSGGGWSIGCTGVCVYMHFPIREYKLKSIL